MEKEAAATDTLEPRRNVTLKSSITLDVMLSKVAISPNPPFVVIDQSRFKLRGIEKAHPHPLHTHFPAVAKQACITYTREGYAHTGVSLIPRGVMQIIWRLFESEPHQNLRYLILNPQCLAKQPFMSSVRHYETDNGCNALAKIIINYHIPFIISHFFYETGEFYLELSRI